MKIFTKMKHALLVVAAMCCVGTAFAVDVTTSYAVVAEDVASDNKVSVEGITLTYGTEATWKTGSATVTVDSKTFTLYATGDNVPSPTNGNIPTSGVYVVFEPEHDGTITAVVQNAGYSKSGYIVEDEDQNLVNGTVLIDGVETAWTSGTPFNSAATYNGEVTFNVKAGSKYYFYMAGSKMRFMGFLYTYDDGYGIVWSQDFEDENTYLDGWTYNATPAYVTSNASHRLDFSHQTANGVRTASYSFTDENFLTATDYIFEFDWGVSPAHYSKDGYTTMTLAANNIEGMLFKTSTRSNVASTSVLSVDGTTELVSITTDNYTAKTPATIFHFIIKGDKNGVTLTITQGENILLADALLSENLVAVTGINVSLNRAYGHMSFDNLSLSVLGAKEGISVPSCSITGTYDVTRTVSIIPGVGTEGTLAEATYYTTNGDEPTKESEKYTEPFTISESCTIKAISYLPDGTASEVCEFYAEAGTVWPLNSNIVKVANLVAGEGEIRNIVIDNCYNNDGVLNNPSVTFSYTFNGEEVALPYTVTEDGTLVATVSADGYVPQIEEMALKGQYAVTRSVDFTTVTGDNVTSLGETWTYDDTAQGRWAWWADGTYYHAKPNSTVLTNLLTASEEDCVLIIGFGVGRNVTSKSTTFSITNGEEGDIALYVVDGSYNKTPANKALEYAHAYADDPTMAHTIVNSPATLAKVSVYSPLRELTVTDGEDLAPEYDYYTSATYTRPITAGAYGTICLPFAPDAASLEAYNFYELTASTVSGTDGEVTFTKVDAPEANKPYIYCLADKDATEVPAITGGATEVSTEAGTTIISGWQMVGSFKAETVDCTDKAIYALNGETQKLMKVTQSLSVPAYRAYIEGTSSQLNLQALTVRISGPTGIEQISAADVEGLLPATIYDLMGRPVQNPQKGHLYIQGGKKVVY